jgi:GxxExxY protein
LRGVPFESQKELRISYKGEPLSQTYRADFVCCEKIIVELKAVKDLAPEHRAQTLNYLKLTHLRLALLVNFASHPKTQIERLIL